MAPSCSISPRLLRILEEYSKVVIAPQGLKDFPPEKINLIEMIRRLVEGSPAMVRRFFLVGLWLFEWSALFFHLNPFTRLLPSDRFRHYQRWNSFFGRQLVRLINVFVFTAYYSHPDVSRSVGFEDKVETTRRKSAPREGILPVPNRWRGGGVEFCVTGPAPGGALSRRNWPKRGMKC